MNTNQNFARLTMLAVGFLMATIAAFSTVENAQATALENCFSKSHAEAFSDNLEQISAEGLTPLLLVDASDNVVGSMSVSPLRQKTFPFSASSVIVNMMSLCSLSLNTVDFYYLDTHDENLLSWFTTKTGTKDATPDRQVTLSQDEGMIVLTPKLIEKAGKNPMVKIDFKAYDVFSENEPSAHDKKNPDYLENWGLPKGKGTFYFRVPSNWKFPN